MDDLTMLRDLGRELEHEPPVTLARQRGRLLDASARPWRRPPRAARGWAMLGLAAGVTAVTVVVPTVLLSGGGSLPLLSGREPVPSPQGERPDKQNEALNVLVVGTDGEAGVPRHRFPGARSDTMILLHLPADRGRITVVNIPRDSMVELPPCTSPKGGTVPARTGMINSAFLSGGLSCAWKAVESTTRVRVDHAVEIDFSGFKGMVDALGGVEVTLPKPVDDRHAKLRLPAGRHLLGGAQALAYARVRYSLGDGSDLARIRRQQQLMSVLVKKAATLPADPVRLSAFLGEAAKWIKTDATLDLRTMRAIALSLDGTGPDAVTFVTVPVRPFRLDRHRLEWAQPAAGELFASIGKDAR
ncbi:LCP family protein [Streptosporangium sp. CA-135522]|uniref:LCP family protein n=1 Tax=Streptosporangium sp. CA-135522 TaxID=3240072 RepID=UPI003D926DD4